MGAWFFSALAMAIVVALTECASSSVVPVASAAFLVVSAICYNIVSVCMVVSISAISAARLVVASAAA